MGFFRKDPIDDDPRLKQLADSVDKYNKEIAKRKDVDQKTKDRIITENIAAYEKHKDQIRKEKK